MQTQLETYLENHIETKVTERISYIRESESKLIGDINSFIERAIAGKKVEIESLAADGLSINAIEAEGGLRALTDLAYELNTYLYPDTGLEIET